MTIEFAIFVGGILLLLGILASKLSDRIAIPSLLLFLAIGMLAGSEGIGNIAFDSPSIAQAIGSFALMVILVSGGLDTNWKSVKQVLAPGLVLSTVGVILTMLLLGAFAKLVLGTYSSFHIGKVGITWLEAMLLAAIISSTDAAAVFSIYRTSPIQPKKKLRNLLEFESGSNDPMAVLLTTVFLTIMTSNDTSDINIAAALTVQFVVGGVIGALIGFCGTWVVNHLKLSTSGLYPILVLSLGMIAFGGADALHGNGYLAVYAAGVIIGNRIKTGHDEIMKFHDGLSWLMQITMFIVLGLLVFPSRLLPVAGVSIALALFLMFVARPLSVMVCYAPFRPGKNELAYVSWVGLRGSVPIVLATFPATYGLAAADQIFHVIFFVVVTSVLIQGFSLVPAAKWLNVVEK